MIVNDLLVKDRITLSMLERVIDLIKLAYLAPSKQRKIYNTEIVKLLTEVKKVKKKHITQKSLEALLEAVNLFRKEPVKSSKDPKQELNEVCAFIAVRLNKSIHEVKEQMTPDELEVIAREINTKYVHDNIDMIRVAHDASKFHKDLVSNLRKISKKSTGDVLDEVKQYEEMKKRLKENKKIAGQIFITDSIL